MSSSGTLVKRATAAPSLVLCKTTIARAAVVASSPGSLRQLSSDSKDDVPRTSTGEPQKLNNFASEVGKKMAQTAPGGESSSPAANSGGHGSDKQDARFEKGKYGDKE